MIMTTNVGAKSIASGAGFGFTKQGDEEATYDQMKERLLHDVEAAFKPEFIGRLDDVIVFRELNRDNLKRIVDIELAKVRERLGERGYALEMTDGAREFVHRQGLQHRVRGPAAPPQRGDLHRGPAERGTAPRGLRGAQLDPGRLPCRSPGTPPTPTTRT